jgi:hypothetical protein
MILMFWSLLCSFFYSFYSFNHDILKQGLCCGSNRGFLCGSSSECGHNPSYVVADPDLVGSATFGLAGSGIMK